MNFFEGGFGMFLKFLFLTSSKCRNCRKKKHMLVGLRKRRRGEYRSRRRDFDLVRDSQSNNRRRGSVRIDRSYSTTKIATHCFLLIPPARDLLGLAVRKQGLFVTCSRAARPIRGNPFSFGKQQLQWNLGSREIMWFIKFICSHFVSQCIS